MAIQGVRKEAKLENMLTPIDGTVGPDMSFPPDKDEKSEKPFCNEEDD